jgi:hypothetical protein
MGGHCDRRNVGFKCEVQEKRDFSLREPTASPRKTIRDAKSAQERSGKKKSARSVRSRKTVRDANGANDRWAAMSDLPTGVGTGAGPTPKGGGAVRPASPKKTETAGLPTPVPEKLGAGGTSSDPPLQGRRCQALPAKSTGSPHKPGQSLALQNRGADGALD